jgi:hypothetical protein
MNRQELINRLVARKMKSKAKGKCKLCVCACMYGAGKAPRMTAAGEGSRRPENRRR